MGGLSCGAGDESPPQKIFELTKNFLTAKFQRELKMHFVGSLGLKNVTTEEPQNRFKTAV
jgi:hypothetical protein